MLSLDHLHGVRSKLAFPARQGAGGEAGIGAGAKLWTLGDPLWELGLAMANIGDIDRQTLAGAVSTGTHGTGRALGSISTQVTSLKLITAAGEIVECSPSREPAIFKAAQVSLGALGVLAEVTLRLLPRYYLLERTWVASFEECLAEMESYIQANRHFEFFWTPPYDACAMKALNPVELQIQEQATTPILLGYEGRAPQGGLARYVREARIDRSCRIFPSERNLKFNETEFAIPYEYGLSCLCELRQLMQSRYPHIQWPVEYRTLAADDIPLSPAYERQSVAISLHQAAGLPYQPFFDDAEAIFRNHRGRPHWGKIHTHSAAELRWLYPRWQDFQTIRQQLDPSGIFLNPYLRDIFLEPKERDQ
jgi:FAD-linked oxidoreductase